jgi:hypothetical protein
MAVSFIPTIWGKFIQATLNKLLIADKICNRNYEGEVKVGNSLKIFMPGDITVKDYTKNTDIADAEVTTEGGETLSIDQQKYFHFFIDGIDIQQVPVNMENAYMNRAVYAIRDVADRFLLGKYVDVAPANVYSPTAPVTASTVYAFFARLHRLLTDSKVPLEGRYATIDGWLLEIINQHLEGKNTSLGDKATADGYLGPFAGFQMYLSHNLAVTDEDMGGSGSTQEVHNVLAGVPDGITFANQIPLEGPGRLRVYEPEKRFGVAVKGLTVYGAEMIQGGKMNAHGKAWNNG